MAEYPFSGTSEFGGAFEDCDPSTLILEYGLEDCRVVLEVLNQIKESDTQIPEQAIWAYLSELSERRYNENPHPILFKISQRVFGDAFQLAVSIIRRQIAEKAARIQMRKARDAIGWIRQEKKALFESLQERIAMFVPSHKSGRLNLATGRVYDISSDESEGSPSGYEDSLWQLSLRIFEMSESERDIVIETGAELTPPSFEDKIEQAAAKAPVTELGDEIGEEEIQAYLSKLAAQLNRLGQPGRELIFRMMNHPDVARAIANADRLPNSISVLASLTESQ